MDGLQITGVEYYEQSEQWVFQLGERCHVSLCCPWRIIDDSRVAVTAGDHLHQLGRPAPIDARQVAMDLLRDRRIIRAFVVEGAGDVRMEFEGGAILESFMYSSGYESGSIQLPSGECIILLGGGSTDSFGAPPSEDK